MSVEDLLSALARGSLSVLQYYTSVAEKQIYSVLVSPSR